MTPYHESDGVTLYHGDCLQVLRTLPSDSIDAVVTDPPYGLSFMGKRWDYDVPSVEIWQQCLRVLKPGGHLLAFAGTRTQHRMAVRIEDAGFEIRDMIAWVYGSGFPKSLDVSKAIDKGHGENRERQLQFTAWMRSTGITAEQINEATGSCMASHYLTDKSQPAIATADMFDKLRPYLPEVPEYIERLVCERTGLEWTAYKQREVVGQGCSAISTRKDLRNDKGTVWGADSSTFNITAPATDAAKQWQGWGTALKPALEPITVARKPFSGTVAETVLQYGTGALNVDGCRVETTNDLNGGRYSNNKQGDDGNSYGRGINKRSENNYTQPAGRWPANLIHDGSDEVTGLFPETGQSGVAINRNRSGIKRGYSGGFNALTADAGFFDTGSAARFFYCAKTSKRDRGETNKHPTVKPTALMRYLCKLITPPGGLVLDPFTGSGSTGRGAVLEGFRFIGMELDAEHVAEAKRRILEVQNGWTDEPEDEPVEDLPGQRLLF